MEIVKILPDEKYVLVIPDANAAWAERILESCTNAAAALMAAAVLLFLVFVGLPAVFIVLLIVWDAALLLSGVAFDSSRLEGAVVFLVDWMTFFGIILGGHFGVALAFGFVAEMLRDVLRWKLSR